VATTGHDWASLALVDSADEKRVACASLAADRFAAHAGRRLDSPKRPSQATECEDLLLFLISQDVAGLEPRSWKELRDAAGFIQDVVVDPGARRSGAATLLLEAAIAWLRGRGVPRVMLWTAEQNADAQRLFAKLGFRRTMIEMTREL
jgi:GNAT superfamily N-acetyltransferase